MHHHPVLLFACFAASAASAAPATVRAQAPGAAAPDTTATATATAGEAADAWAPRTGDAVVDARLSDINTYAERYPDAFIDELVRYFDAPRPLLQTLLDERRAPGDLYYACALARVSGRPCRGVIEAWLAAGGGEWEALARDIGVQPGDARARRLREGIADSYRRWDRRLPAAD